jgi:hypothetical protein
MFQNLAVFQKWLNIFFLGQAMTLTVWLQILIIKKKTPQIVRMNKQFSK